MKRVLLPLVIVAAACASSTALEPFSVDELVANAPTYVASRYERGELPAALITDLTAAGFECQHSAAGSACTRARQAFASCFDVITVDITSDAVRAESARRCMGAEE
ncbi:MAG: hypothetical protein U1E03_07460 [Hyphomonadaceae bacterium]